VTRAVVTGVGVVTPAGLTVADVWQAALAARIGIGPIDRFDVSRYPSRLAGQVAGFDPRDHLPDRLLPQTDLSTQFALVAAEAALLDAAVDPTTLVDYDMGVVTGNAAGGFDFTHREFDKLWSKGPGHVSVYESFAWFYAVNTGQISIRHGMRGPSSALVSEQASGLDAMGHARRTVRRGTPLVLTGGVDSALDPWGWASHIASGRVSRSGDPGTAYRPCAGAAAGYVPGEGGATLVLEDEQAAAERGARQVYGEIAGHAATFDPPPGSARPPGLRRAIEAALADAGVAASEVDVVFADAAADPALDRAEAEALAAVFGAGAVPVAAPKASFGRLLAGGGPLDVVLALLAIRDGLVPPVPVLGASAVGASDVGGPAVDLVVGEARAAEVRTALVLARGRWGFNSALMVRRARPLDPAKETV
jgi:act minimal PKS chain-length factor (CLF/KS beta)